MINSDDAKIEKPVFINIAKPDSEPTFPEDVTTSSADDLGKLLSQYTRWKNYAISVLSSTEADLYLAKETLEITRAKVMVSLCNDGDLKSTYKAADDRKAYVASREAVAKLSLKVARLLALSRMQKAVFGTFDDRYACASRELTRRGQYVG